MLTSDSALPPRSRIWREVVALAFAGTCVTMIASPADPALLSWSVHPVWGLALVLAARHGAAGLWIVPALALGPATASFLTGHGAEGVVERMSRGGDIAALVAVALCAAVGAAHQRRQAVLADRLVELEARAKEAEAAVDKLADTAIALHSRCDRSATSLAFLAEIAARLDGPEPTRAAEAAVELAMARTGARAGFVQQLESTGYLRTLTTHGPRVLRDRTAGEALKRGAVVTADEVTAVRAEDSDLAAPLIDEAGEVVGVLALYGVAYSALDPTIRAEVAGVARWTARTISRARRDEASRDDPSRDRAESSAGFYLYTRRGRNARA